MKIKKIVFLIIFMLFLFPFTIQAEECKKTDIKIEKVELSEVSGNAEETSTASNDHNQIHLNTKMNVVGDSITYKAVIKNTSNSDYVFDKTQLTKDYINYDIRYEDDSNIIKAGEEKVIYLRLNYEIKPQVETLSNGVYTSNSQVSFHFVNESGTILNPETKNNVFIIFLIFAIIIGGLIIQRKNSKKVSIMIAILSLFILPKMVNAICTCTLDIHLNLKIDAKEATFLSGKEVNIKMKQLAGDDTSTVTNAYAFQDKLITSIQYSEVEPDSINKEEKNIVSTPESEYPIYMWYDNETIYWWSEDKTPSLNEDASFMFNHIQLLNNIVGLETFDVSNNKNMNSLLSLTSLKDLSYLKNWNTSNVESMSSSFLNIYCLESLSGLENWNTSKVTTMNSLFSTNLYLNNIDAIKNWNVENVENMSMMFLTNLKLEEIDLSNWNTSSLKDMSFMIGMGTPADGTKAILKRIILSDKFDTSNVTDMSFAFYNNNVIEDYTFLKILDTSNVTTIQDIFYNNWNLDSTEFMKDWDVSNIKNMSAAFIGTNLTSLDNFINWNTISVTDMSYMFRDCYSLESLNGIENWDVSQVNNYRSMFDGDNKINNASSINEWNVSKTADFTRMFAGVPVLPEFSKVNGVWKNGTFTPGS